MKGRKKVLSVVLALCLSFTGLAMNASASAETYTIDGKTYEVDQTVVDFSGKSCTDSSSPYADFCTTFDKVSKPVDENLYLVYDINVNPGAGSPGAKIEVSMFLGEHGYNIPLYKYLTGAGELGNGQTKGLLRLGDVVTAALAEQAWNQYEAGVTTFGDFHLYMGALYGGTVDFTTFKFVSLKEVTTSSSDTTSSSTEPSSKPTDPAKPSDPTEAPVTTTTVEVDPQVKPVTKDEYYTMNGKKYKVTGIVAEEDALGLSKQTIEDTVPPDKWFVSKSDITYRDTYYLVYDFTVTAGSDAIKPSVLFEVCFDGEEGSRLKLQDALGYGKDKGYDGLPGGHYTGMIKLSDVMGSSLQDKVSKFYGTYIYEGALYGGNIKIDRYAIVTAAEASGNGSNGGSPNTGVELPVAAAAMLLTSVGVAALCLKKHRKDQ